MAGEQLENRVLTGGQLLDRTHLPGGSRGRHRPQPARKFRVHPLERLLDKQLFGPCGVTEEGQRPALDGGFSSTAAMWAFAEVVLSAAARSFGACDGIGARRAK